MKVEKCLSLRKKSKEDSKLNHLPVTIEDKIIQDIYKVENKKKAIVSNCNEVSENWLPDIE